MLRNTAWSVGLIGLLAYIYAIVSFRLPIGTAAAAVTVVGGLIALQDSRIPNTAGILVIYFLWAGLCSLLGDWPATSLDAMLEFGKVVLVFIATSAILADSRRIVLVMVTYIACFLLYPVRGVFVGGDDIVGRAVWNFIYSNPNDLAALTLLDTGLILALLAFRWKQRWVRVGMLLLVALQVFLIVKTQSRGVMLGVIGVAAVAISTAPAALRKKLLIWTAITAAFIAIFTPARVVDRYFAGFSAEEDGSRSTDMRVRMAAGSKEERTAIAKGALDIAMANPIIGVGLGAFPKALNEAVPSLGPRDTHNTFLNIACEVGIPGLAIMLTFLGSMARDARRAIRVAKGRRPDLASAILLFGATIAGFLVAGMFGTYLKLTPPFLIMAIFNAICIGAERQMRVESQLAHCHLSRRDSLSPIESEWSHCPGQAAHRSV